MRLSHLRIRGFRCHHDLQVDVGDLTVFIGANDSGKTGILNAVDILINGQNPSADDYCSVPGALAETITVEGTFEFTDRDQSAGRGAIGEKVTLRRVAGRDIRPVLQVLAQGFEEDELNTLDQLSNDRLEDLVNEKGLPRPDGGSRCPVSDFLRQS